MEYKLNGSGIVVSLQEVHIDTVVGESAKMEVQKAVNYIQSGKAEIEAGVDAVLREVDDHVADKTAEFDLNASNKTGDFNTNAINKTTDFNDNYVAKKALIDAEVGIAQTAATNASNSADLSKQWAIGDPTEPAEGSAKYWATQSASAAATVNNPTITLTQGGVTKGSFTLNQATGDTIEFDAGGGGAVDSVNGYTGVVVLTASDVGALATSDVTEYTAAEVETLWGSI